MSRTYTTMMGIVLSASALILGGCAAMQPDTRSQEELQKEDLKKVVTSNYETEKVYVVDVDGYDVCNNRPMKETLKINRDGICHNKTGEDKEKCLKTYDPAYVTKDTEIIKSRSDGVRLFHLVGVVLGAATGDAILSSTSLAEGIPNGEFVALSKCTTKTFFVVKKEDQKDFSFTIGAPWFGEKPYKSIDELKDKTKEQALLNLMYGAKFDNRRFLQKRESYIVRFFTPSGEESYIFTPKELDLIVSYREELLAQKSAQK